MSTLSPTRFAAIAFVTRTQAPVCNDLSCRLGAWLHVLYATAAVLAVLLLIIIAAIALQTYRQNKKANFLPE